MSDFNDQDEIFPSPGHEGGVEEPKSMTLSGISRGDAPPDEMFLEDTPKRNNLLSHSAVLIGVVLVVAVGSIFIMRASQGEFTTSDDVKEIEAKITNTLDRLNKPSLLKEDDPLRADNLKSLLTSTEDVTAIFDHDVREQQVPIEEVKKDPFSLALKESDAQNVSDDKPKVDQSLSKLKAELKKLDLQSIMMGARNIAVIGGEFYKQGDQVGNFSITQIDKLTVHLQSAGHAFELHLETGGR